MKGRYAATLSQSCGGAKCTRPSFDPVTMFKALILQAPNSLSEARIEFTIRDRLRCLGLSLEDRTPNENTIRHFRNRLT
jgi:IS5 family transposase